MISSRIPSSIVTVERLLSKDLSSHSLTKTRFLIQRSIGGRMDNSRVLSIG